MAFWGIEIKPGKPYIHRYDNESGRLHISQATLGNGSSAKRTLVQCSVGDKKPIYLCSLLPEKLETCALNLEFDEDDEEVTFSVAGEHSVHLSGFFYGEPDETDNSDGDYDLDSYGEGMVETDSEDDSVYDSEDDGDDDFTDDDDLDIYPSSPVPNSGVTIEEIVDEKKPTVDNGMSKRAKKKKDQLGKSDDKENSNHQIVVKSGTDVPILESEDEDGFPISGQDKTNVSKSEAKLEDTNIEKSQKKNEKDAVASGKNLKRKLEADGQDGETARENVEPHDSSVKPDSTVPENEVKQKKNKKKKVSEKMESAQGIGTPTSSASEQPQVAETGNNLKASSEKTKEKQKKNQKKQQETAAIPNAEDKLTDKKGEETGKAKGKSLQVRTFSNGLMIEELKMGRPDGKRASAGKKVSVHYVGKLKKNDKIFDSNIGRAPFKFRLGIGQVIKGWDVGVNGMRIGDKRRLTIPPSMGYGAKGCPGAIPPNSWLVFEVELVDVN